MSFDLSSLRAQFPMLKRRVNDTQLHYLDNAATTFCPDTVLEAMTEFETQHRANVKRGVHRLADEATEAYEAARHQVGQYLKVPTEEIIFTSGATAAINLVAQSYGLILKPGDQILVSLAEHHSNFVPWQLLQERCGVKLRAIPLRQDGRIDTRVLDHLVNEDCRLIAVTHASNVTGAITDLAPITRAAQRVGARVLVDGAQAVAHGPVDVSALGVDFYVFSGHKCYGPTGIGVLWGKQSALAELTPVAGGGGVVERVTLEKTQFIQSNQRFEAGTPPIAQAIGLGAALAWLSSLPWPALRVREQHLSQYLLNTLLAFPQLRVIGPLETDKRLPIVSFDIKDCHPHDICHILDQQGLALRGGHHCAQPLLQVFKLLATSRASLALFNDEDDIDALSLGLKQAIEILT